MDVEDHFAASTKYGIQIQRRATVCFQSASMVHMSCLHPQQLFPLYENVHVSRLDSPGEYGYGEYDETCRRNSRASYSEVRRVLHGCTEPLYLAAGTPGRNDVIGRYASLNNGTRRDNDEQNACKISHFSHLYQPPSQNRMDDTTSCPLM